MNWSAYSLPTLWISLMDFTILGSIAFLVSSWTNSHSSSLIINGLPNLFVSVTRQSAWVLKRFWNAPVSSRCLYSVFLVHFKTEFSSNSNKILAASGPQSIYSLSLCSSSVMPVAPPSPLTSLFSYLWHWPIPIGENALGVLEIIKFPSFIKASFTSGLVWGNIFIS